MNLFTTLALAGMIGFRAVWSVTPALHSPLMCELHLPFIPRQGSHVFEYRYDQADL